MLVCEGEYIKVIKKVKLSVVEFIIYVLTFNYLYFVKKSSHKIVKIKTMPKLCINIY